MEVIYFCETLTFNGLHGVISQKIVVYINTVMRTSDAIEYFNCSLLKLFVDRSDETYRQRRESTQNRVCWVQLLRNAGQGVGGLYLRDQLRDHREVVKTLGLIPLLFLSSGLGTHESSRATRFHFLRAILRYAAPVSASSLTAFSFLCCRSHWWSIHSSKVLSALYSPL
jgi:hypothetical protein